MGEHYTGRDHSRKIFRVLDQLEHLTGPLTWVRAEREAENFRLEQRRRRFEVSRSMLAPVVPRVNRRRSSPTNDPRPTKSGTRSRRPLTGD